MLRSSRKREASVPAPAQAGGVVLLHGIAVGSWTLKRMQRAIEQAGFVTLNLDYASRRKRLDALAADCHPAIADFAARHDGPIHLVGHSMGGLLARVYLDKYRPEQLGRVVMLGTPNGGSEVADLLKDLAIYRRAFGPAGLQLTTEQDDTLTSLPPLDYPVGIIAGNRTISPISSLLILPGPNDGRVSVRSTRLEGMADHVVVKSSHTWLVRHSAAIDQTIAFLRDGRFKMH
jgi:pimeloyl-ACP methyl ester carboxylesterase